MLMQPTLQKLKALKLSGMAEALLQLQENTESEGLSFDERFGIIVDREELHRENKRQARLIKGAKLRSSQACIEDVNYHHKRGLEKSLISAFSQCDWIRRKQNIIFTGPTGIGKTYLACALGQRACQQGFSTRYFRVTRLLEEIRLSQGCGKYMIFMNQLSKTDVLILDDWGLGQLNKNERQDMLEILEDRHALKSTVITTQVPVQFWHEYIGDATIADAVLDRLLSGAHKLELQGESLRKKGVDLDSK